ncbi:MAG: SAM-dependent methyltransferase [Lachnospiraceae bacterium]|nr:SAM-dependent methyltransferase [Lachnospiraceae bacterium]
MSDLTQSLAGILADAPDRLILSKQAAKTQEYRKVIIEKKNDCYQIARYTEKQVFHENCDAGRLADYLKEAMGTQFLQLNGWSEGKEHQLLMSKKGTVTYKKKVIPNAARPQTTGSHNRRKNYLLQEGSQIPPLIDMGVFTKEGKVVHAMYDKFRQINRFIELIDDAVGSVDKPCWHIINFGCGKSYLTFILYYYFTEIKKQPVEIIGLDLKADVIEKCNLAAQKYGYDRLRFELGDINGYQAPFNVDIVVTLHACDTATDYALYNAICWNADMIFSGPCCQHELNGQMHTDTLALFTRYGIVQERMAALTTDAIRGNLLTCMGYKTQLLEFVDLSHTPKNLLIRAVRSPSMSKKTRQTQLDEVHAVMDTFHVEPTLYRLLRRDELIS